MKLQGLGVLSALPGEYDRGALRARLCELRGRFVGEDRAAVIAYLRGCPSIFAIMEYTRDVLEDAFGVSGGSAIQSDGDFFWRRDTADYVEHYGVELPKAFLEHGRRRRWALPTLSRDELLAIDGYLMGLRRPAR